MQVGLRHFDSRTLDWFVGALRHPSRSGSRALRAHRLAQRAWSSVPVGGRCCRRSSSAWVSSCRGASPTVVPAVPSDDARLPAAGSRPGLAGGRHRRSPAPGGDDGDAPPAGMDAPAARYATGSARSTTARGIGFATWRARDKWMVCRRPRRQHQARDLPSSVFSRRPGLRAGVLRMAAERVADDREARGASGGGLYSCRRGAVTAATAPAGPWPGGGAAARGLGAGERLALHGTATSTRRPGGRL